MAIAGSGVGVAVGVGSGVGVAVGVGSGVGVAVGSDVGVAVGVGSGVGVAIGSDVGVAVGVGSGVGVAVGSDVGSGVGVAVGSSVGLGPTLMLESPPTACSTRCESRRTPEKEWGPSALGAATVYVKRSSPSSVKATVWPSTATAALDRSEPS